MSFLAGFVQGGVSGYDFVDRMRTTAQERERRRIDIERQKRENELRERQARLDAEAEEIARGNAGTVPTPPELRLPADPSLPRAPQAPTQGADAVAYPHQAAPRAEPVPLPPVGQPEIAPTLPMQQLPMQQPQQQLPMQQLQQQLPVQQQPQLPVQQMPRQDPTPQFLNNDVISRYDAKIQRAMEAGRTDLAMKWSKEQGEYIIKAAEAADKYWNSNLHPQVRRINEAIRNNKEHTIPQEMRAQVDALIGKQHEMTQRFVATSIGWLSQPATRSMGIELLRKSLGASEISDVAEGSPQLLEGLVPPGTERQYVALVDKNGKVVKDDNGIPMAFAKSYISQIVTPQDQIVKLGPGETAYSIGQGGARPVASGGQKQRDPDAMWGSVLQFVAGRFGLSFNPQTNMMSGGSQADIAEAARIAGEAISLYRNQGVPIEEGVERLISAKKKGGEQKPKQRDGRIRGLLQDILEEQR